LKTLSFKSYGGIDALQLIEVDMPKPKNNEVLIKVYAASLNDWDTSMSAGRPFFMRYFTGLFRPKPEFQNPGCDVAGRVESVGANARQLNVGDKVYGDLCNSGFGSFAEYICVKEFVLAPMPKGMTYEQAACLPQAGQLVVQGLIETGGLRAGQKLLINGAGGGVGTLAVQIAKHIGCEITVVDKASKLDMMLSLGADHAIDYEQKDFCNTGEQYDLILDTKTTRLPFSHSKALKRDGQYVTVGGSMTKVLLGMMLSPLLSRFSGKRHRLVAQKPNTDLPVLSEMFATGKLIPVIDSTHDLSNFRDAYELYLSAIQKGKVIIQMNKTTT